VFWAAVEKLEAVVYFHPRFPHKNTIESLYSGRKALLGACWSFAGGVGTLILGLCTNGAFDRFPRAKVVIGHMGMAHSPVM
jgi:2,3-dihydroxybenzoate decarboxylase